MLQPGSTIGIIGGGQLGRMLAIAAARLGFRTIILEPQIDCPASQTANKQITAAYDDATAITQLAHICDVITYEFENVPLSVIQKLAKKKPVYPPPIALEISQDRFREKTFLNECGITTAAWQVIHGEEDLITALAAFGGRGILKTQRFGYDGKGQIHFRGDANDNISAAFVTIGHVPAILEEWVEFQCEISVIAARDCNGSVQIYDIAENIHSNGILATSTVPASVSSTTAIIAQEITEKLLHALDYVGILGVELFVLPDGTLLANEFAPRVHNSGHWTEAACAISQFEQHIRAVSGLPLGATTRHCDCVMENLIGNDILSVPEILKEPNAILHLYGKMEVRPDRKMGHVTRLKMGK